MQEEFKSSFSWIPGFLINLFSFEKKYIHRFLRFHRKHMRRSSELGATLVTIINSQELPVAKRAFA